VSELEKSSATSQNGSQAEGLVKPVVKIDNESDPFATVVSMRYGNKLGELLDTTAALKNLGLNIRRAKVKPKGDMMVNKFYITDAHTSEKILKSARLEEIRATIFNNLLKYHPESGEDLGWGAKASKPTSRDLLSPLGLRNRSTVETMIQVIEHDSGSYSEVWVETADRPGVLTQVVSVLKDLNVNVVSADIETEGNMAKDKFYVTYHGEPLPQPMVLLVTNALQYHLALAEIEREESY
jgi:UTP:GlnB (protein PII) uridylyltransferase